MPLGEPFGWCGLCAASLCHPCGRTHLCTPDCPANGCQAGFCVREVRGARISETWGLPPE
ncbi:MAG: hypothetical protein AVDCRST_MAG33-515 [uncultured Thermomicrobiales bacterium]|uniref:Uncharacterized protein n=1 Tax=uncultured Thermomicrobiales bacterium TaxID=1645740 RepID=A0A6J4UCD6_9BACT|nr:MAG: hypothetical protein AVDCRST_MAG33-515 [uncultured Thermomicrobiales bacterium]